MKRSNVNDTHQATLPGTTAIGLHRRFRTRHRRRACSARQTCSSSVRTTSSTVLAKSVWRAGQNSTRGETAMRGGSGSINNLKRKSLRSPVPPHMGF
jgi:hypothetical protein